MNRRAERRVTRSQREENKQYTNKINYIKSAEAGLMAAGLAGLGAGTLHLADMGATAILGLPPGEVSRAVVSAGPELVARLESAPHASAFGVGFGIGVAKNIGLIAGTLYNLRDKTEPSTGMPMTVSDGGKHVKIQITCADKRRGDLSGGAYPGSFGVLGAEFRSILEAGLNAAIFSPHSPLLGDAMAGYYIGSNVVTFGLTHMQLAKEINKCVTLARANPDVDIDAHIQIVMQDHWGGCGAMAFTDFKSYIAKFMLHNKPSIGGFGVADLIALPNEALGYVWTNLVLNKFVSAVYGKQVSLEAEMIKHSPMKS